VPDATSERRPTGAATSNARGGCSPISRTCFGFSVSGRDGIGLVFVHVRPPPAVGRLLELPREHEVFSEFPAEATPDGRPRVVLVGETNAALQAAPDDTPPELSVSVERIGPYAGTDDPAAVLTDELGYYEVPRGATRRDIADRLGLSVGTVGEHLQKVGARVLGGSSTGCRTPGRPAVPLRAVPCYRRSGVV
jgi:hypothetical protein